MTLIVKFEETDPRVDPRSLKGNNFYHFHNIAVPRINDLLFRRRLFGTVWSSRKEALARIKGFLGTGKQFNRALLEEDLSVQRDYLLMFGSKDQIIKTLHEEALYLPPNQTHQHHEKYALIAQLGRSRPANADLESSHEDAVLLETLAFIDRNTPKVTASWVKCWVEEEEGEEGVHVGPNFLAPSVEQAGKFETELNEALENFSNKHRGLCAFGFLPPDPLLFTPKNIEQEKRTVTEIVTILQENAAKEEIRPESLDLNERNWIPERLPASEAD